MLILTIRTDKPESEVGLFNNDEKIAYYLWEAHRKLAETLNFKIEDLLKSNKLKIGDIEGILVYRGPGSFTGLRIGISVVNTLSYAMSVPVVGSSGENWLKEGITLLLSGSNDRLVLPLYGSEVHITLPKK